LPIVAAFASGRADIAAPMTTEPHSGAEAPYWSLSGLREGAWRAGPLLPGTMIFSTAFGALAAQKGLTLTETVLMNLLVMTGIAQLLALEVWTDPMTLGTIISVTTLTLVISARLILMGASLRPWMGTLPSWQIYPVLLLTTDANWIVAMRYRAEKGGGDAAILAGAGLALWACWVGAVVPGYLLGAVIKDPKTFGIDLMLPIFFVAMLVQLWRGPRRAIGWVVAGVVGLIASFLLPGFWFIVIGAVVGSIVGGFVDDPQ
jgi:predicted branched-subunit amino acid permease